MLNRTSLFAFAAVATLGLAALAPVNAYAKGGHGGGGAHGGGHGGGGHAMNHGGRGGHGDHGHKGGRGDHGHKGHGDHGRRHHWHPRHHVVRWHNWDYGNGYRVVRPAVSTYSVAKPVTPTCTCLTKEYLESGAVLFKDVCTQESAMNPPEDQQAQNQ